MADASEVFEPPEVIAQNDKVVSLMDVEASVRNTGRAIRQHETRVWTFRDGTLARLWL